MSRKRTGRLLAALVFSTALVSLPAGQSAASEAEQCTWQRTEWELPAGTEIGSVEGYDGSRYAVGVTGQRPLLGGNIVDPRGTLWDDGTVVLRAGDRFPQFRDVNSAGIVVGSTIADDGFIGVTIDHDGTPTALPADPEWTGYSAWAINNAGDIAGWAHIGTQTNLVVWPGDAPGTYRETAAPELSSRFLVDIDEQGRVIVQTDSGAGGGFVVGPDGRWHGLAPAGEADFATPQAIRDGRIVGSSDNAWPSGTRRAP